MLWRGSPVCRLGELPRARLSSAPSIAAAGTSKAQLPAPGTAVGRDPADCVWEQEHAEEEEVLLAVSWQKFQGRTVGGCAELPWRDEEVRGSLEACPGAGGSSELRLCFCCGAPLHPPVWCVYPDYRGVLAHLAVVVFF